MSDHSGVDAMNAAERMDDEGITPPRPRCAYPDCACPIAWQGEGKPPATVCVGEPCPQCRRLTYTMDKDTMRAVACPTCGGRGVVAPGTQGQKRIGAKKGGGDGAPC